MTEKWGLDLQRLISKERLKRGFLTTDMFAGRPLSYFENEPLKVPLNELSELLEAWGIEREAAKIWLDYQMRKSSPEKK